MQSCIEGWVFFLLPPFFKGKMAAIMNFEKKIIYFQKAQLDPREVIMWKFEGPTSNGLVAMRGTNTYTNKYIHKHIYPQTKQ